MSRSKNCLVVIKRRLVGWQPVYVANKGKRNIFERAACLVARNARRQRITCARGSELLLLERIKRAKCDWLCCIPRVNAARKTWLARGHEYIYNVYIYIVCIFNSSSLNRQRCGGGGGVAQTLNFNLIQFTAHAALKSSLENCLAKHE